MQGGRRSEAGGWGCCGWFSSPGPARPVLRVGPVRRRARRGPSLRCRAARLSRRRCRRRRSGRPGRCSGRCGPRRPDRPRGPGARPALRPTSRRPAVARQHHSVCGPRGLRRPKGRRGHSCRIRGSLAGPVCVTRQYRSNRRQRSARTRPPVLGDRPLSTLCRIATSRGLSRLSPTTWRPGRCKRLRHGEQGADGRVDDQLIVRSPCTRIVLPAAPDVEIEAPTAEQAHHLVAAVEPRYRALVCFPPWPPAPTHRHPHHRHRHVSPSTVSAHPRTFMPPLCCRCCPPRARSADTARDCASVGLGWGARPGSWGGVYRVIAPRACTNNSAVCE